MTKETPVSSEPAAVAAPPVETSPPIVEPPVEATPPAEPAYEPVKVDAYGLDEGFGESLKTFADKAKLGQEDLDGLVGSYQQHQQAVVQAQQEQMRVEGEAFVETWGEAKESNLAVVRQSLKAVDPDGAVTKMLNESGYGNHPAVLGMFLKFGEHLKEGSFLKSENNAPPAPKTAAQAMFGQAHPSQGAQN